MNRLLKVVLVGLVIGLLTNQLITHYEKLKYQYITLKNQYYANQLSDMYMKMRMHTGRQGDVAKLIFITEGPEAGIVNAWTDGVTMYITLALVDRADNMDQVAFVMAHEIAHGLLGHVGTDPYNNLSTILKENQADQLGAFILMRSGYDICEGRKLNLVLRENFGEYDESDHPSFSARLYRLKMPWCAGEL